MDGGNLTINDLTLTKGRVAANAKGGALMVQNGGQVIVNDSRFKDNIAKEGGAIWVSTSRASVTVNNSSFVGNRAVNLGAGGAIDMNGGRVVVNRSSFINNAASAIGGAISTWRTGQVIVTNSTFSGNRSDKGGAIHSGGAPIILTHVTMVDNFASDGAALHSYESYPGRIRLRNSIVYTAGPLGPTLCTGNPLAQSVGNAISDDSCGMAGGADPQLGGLTGEPAWHPLAQDSPAIAAADVRFCSTIDQVGTARPQGGCDIGAIEWTADGAARQDLGAFSQTLPACTVTTTDMLNFRDGPNGNKIGLVAKNASVTARKRTPGWFQVEYRGRSGWISADYVVTEGECG